MIKCLRRRIDKKLQVAIKLLHHKKHLNLEEKWRKEQNQNKSGCEYFVAQVFKTKSCCVRGLDSLLNPTGSCDQSCATEGQEKELVQLVVI